MKLIILIMCQLGFILGNPLSLVEENVPLTPEEQFESVKNLLGGYPFELISTAVNDYCSAVLPIYASIFKNKPDINKMAFQLRTPCKKIRYPLLNADEMSNSPEFNTALKTVILITGFLSNVNSSDHISEMAQAYNCRGDVNFIALDAAYYLDTFYIKSALNTVSIGESVGVGLVQLTKIIPVENIHLIGHSLGAHVAGTAGRTFTNMTGKQIPRITGLDAAKPCFEGNGLTGLLLGDAKFIDIIHTDPGVFGKRYPLGDVDFYPSGLNPLQKGCLDVVCSHIRAELFYTESVYPGNENNFMAVPCSSFTNLKNNECSGQSFPMGYATPQNLRGIYTLDVNPSPPYGKNGSKTREEQNKMCGLCQDNTTN